VTFCLSGRVQVHLLTIQYNTIQQFVTRTKSSIERRILLNGVNLRMFMQDLANTNSRAPGKNIGILWSLVQTIYYNIVLDTKSHHPSALQHSVFWYCWFGDRKGVWPAYLACKVNLNQIATGFTLLNNPNLGSSRLMKAIKMAQVGFEPRSTV